MKAYPLHETAARARNLTEADIRLFVTLVRFDAAYHGLFKANKRRIVDYPNLNGYLQRLLLIPALVLLLMLRGPTGSKSGDSSRSPAGSNPKDGGSSVPMKPAAADAACDPTAGTGGQRPPRKE